MVRDSRVHAWCLCDQPWQCAHTWTLLALPLERPPHRHTLAASRRLGRKGFMETLAYHASARGSWRAAQLSSRARDPSTPSLGAHVKGFSYARRRRAPHTLGATAPVPSSTPAQTPLRSSRVPSRVLPTVLLAPRPFNQHVFVCYRPSPMFSPHHTRRTKQGAPSVAVHK